MATTSKAGLSILALVLLGGGGWYAKESSSSCMVGVKNAEATLTISGFGSSDECADMARQDHDLYVRESPTDGGVLCEVKRGRRHYIVRDKGMFMFIGREMCSRLDKAAALAR